MEIGLDKLEQRLEHRREWLVRLNKEIKKNFDPESLYQSRGFIKHRKNMIKVILKVFDRMKRRG